MRPVAGSKPSTAFAVMLFPQPDSPTIPTASPAWTSKLTSRNTVDSPSVTVSPRTANTSPAASAGPAPEVTSGEGSAGVAPRWFVDRRRSSDAAAVDRPIVASRTASPNSPNAATVTIKAAPVGTSIHGSWLIALDASATILPQLGPLVSGRVRPRNDSPLSASSAVAQNSDVCTIIGP